MFLNKKPIVVLGMQRSGTSAVAGALARLGFYLGASDDFFPADGNNTAGYFEQRSLTTFNHKCLNLFQVPVASTRGLPENWLEYPQSRMLAEELKALLRKGFEDEPLWGFKQPMASLLLPLYRLAFEELDLQPQVVVCVRNPLEIRASEERWIYESGGRQMAPLGSHAVGAWLNYTLGALDGYRETPSTVIPYASFAADPRPFLERILAIRDDVKPSDSRWQDAVESVQTNLKRNAADIQDLDRYPSIVKELLDLCGTYPYDSSRLQKLQQEFKTWQAMLAPPKLSGTKIGIAWHQNGQVHSSQIPFLPSGGWQTVRFEIEAPPRTQLNGLLYNKSCRVWIRRSVFASADGETVAIPTPGPGSNIAQVGPFLRLEGAYEARQLNWATPGTGGPMTLELEILLEAGQTISNDAAARVADRLHQCTARKMAIERGSK